MSFLISIIAGTLSIGQHQKHWIEYRAICESLRPESFLFQAKVSPYDTSDVYAQLVHRVEGILTKENATGTQFMMKESKPEKSGKT